MADFDVIAEPRSDLGKAAVRRMRRAGRVPGIVYGAEKDPAPISLTENVLRKQMENEAFFSHILTLKVQGEPDQQAVVKALQRHPATARVMHLDLLRVSATHKLTLTVPLHFENEASCPGVRQGGVISHELNEVEVSCLPADLPEYIAVDVGELELGVSLHLSDLVVPSGVELTGLTEDSDPGVLHIALPRGGGDEVEDEDADEEAEGGEESPEE